MLVDAGFTSVGINYFQVVVPKVQDFERHFVTTGEITMLADLAALSRPTKPMLRLWGNKRSWGLIFECARVLLKHGNGIDALKAWARQADHHRWHADSVGRIHGVGINTFQYLRMMGGVDTAMPDRIVLKVLRRICSEARIDFESKTLEGYIDEIERLAELTGYRPIELCWATWLLESDPAHARSII